MFECFILIERPSMDIRNDKFIFSSQSLKQIVQNFNSFSKMNQIWFVVMALLFIEAPKSDG